MINLLIIIVCLIEILFASPAHAVEVDNFDRPNNTTLGLFWGEESNANASILNYKLSVASSSYTDLVYTTETCQSCEVWVQALQGNTTSPSINLRATPVGNTYYSCRAYAGDILQIGRWDSGVYSNLVENTSITFVTGRTYTLYAKIYNSGGNVELECRAYGDSSPDGRKGSLLATVTYTDSSANKITEANVVGLSSSAGVEILYDNFLMINNDVSNVVVDTINVSFELSPQNNSLNPWNDPWNNIVR